MTGLDKDSGKILRLCNALFKRLPDPDRLHFPLVTLVLITIINEQESHHAEHQLNLKSVMETMSRVQPISICIKTS